MAYTETQIQKKIYIYVRVLKFLDRQTLHKAYKIKNLKPKTWARWLRIRLPMQGTRVPSLVREDPTRRGATKPMRHNYWACALEPPSHNYLACVPQLLKPTCLELVLPKRSHRNEKPTYHNEEKPVLAATRQNPRAATKTQCSQKNTYIYT